jgi:hypothetical protein
MADAHGFAGVIGDPVSMLISGNQLSLPTAVAGD